ncbi:hypothetical protein R83H12_02550 [Fibrobacteria bacterium R8-3-H12]
MWLRTMDENGKFAGLIDLYKVSEFRLSYKNEMPVRSGLDTKPYIVFAYYDSALARIRSFDSRADAIKWFALLEDNLNRDIDPFCYQPLIEPVEAK